MRLGKFLSQHQRALQTVLGKLSGNRQSWLEENLYTIHTLLFSPFSQFFEIDTTSSPEPFNTEVLKAISDRIAQMRTAAMGAECMSFVKRMVSRDYGPIETLLLPQRFLQSSAIISFYLGDYEKAAMFASVLGDTFWANQRFESNWASGLFNEVAALAYREMGNIELACRHYQQYIESNCHENAEDYLETLAYLIGNRRLKISDATIVNHLKFLLSKDLLDESLRSEASHFLPIVTELYECFERKKVEESAKKHPHTLRTADDRRAEAGKRANINVTQLQDLFGEQISYDLDMKAGVKTVLERLTALKEQHNRLSVAIYCAPKDKEVDIMELCYRRGKTNAAIKKAFESIGASFVRRMTLQDIHTLIQLDETRGHQYAGSLIFGKYANVIALKIRNSQDFLSLAQFKREEMDWWLRKSPVDKLTFCGILLFKTTGKERIHLLSVIAEKVDEMKHIPNSGITEENFLKIKQESSNVARQKRENTRRSMSVTLFAAMQMPDSVSATEMAQSAFGKRR